MTPPKKPDWMEIADNDGGSNYPAPKAKKTRAVLIAATALVLTFGGAVIAQSNQGSPTSNEQSTEQSMEQAIVPQASQSATSVAPAFNNAATPAPAVSAPAIATPPNMKGGDDDEDHDGDFREGKHRDRGERDHDDDDEFEDH